jgi:hypothetical protein
MEGRKKGRHGCRSHAHHTIPLQPCARPCRLVSDGTAPRPGRRWRRVCFPFPEPRAQQPRFPSTSIASHQPNLLCLPRLRLAFIFVLGLLSDGCTGMGWPWKLAQSGECLQIWHPPQRPRPRMTRPRRRWSGWWHGEKNSPAVPELGSWCHLGPRTLNSVFLGLWTWLRVSSGSLNLASDVI